MESVSKKMLLRYDCTTHSDIMTHSWLHLSNCLSPPLPLFWILSLISTLQPWGLSLEATVVLHTKLQSLCILDHPPYHAHTYMHTPTVKPGGHLMLQVTIFPQESGIS